MMIQWLSRLNRIYNWVTKDLVKRRMEIHWIYKRERIHSEIDHFHNELRKSLWTGSTGYGLDLPDMDWIYQPRKGTAWLADLRFARPTVYCDPWKTHLAVGAAWKGSTFSNPFCHCSHLLLDGTTPVSWAACFFFVVLQNCKTLPPKKIFKNKQNKKNQFSSISYIPQRKCTW